LAWSAWQVTQRDARMTASPNAGWPMAAMAGALGVELEKVGQYTLGRGQRAPAAGDIERALRLLRVVALLAVAGAALATNCFSSGAGRRRPAAGAQGVS
jgi:adenosylcobinamide-phosphate synthase